MMEDPRVQLGLYHPGDIGNNQQDVDQARVGNNSGAAYRASYGTDADGPFIAIEGLFTPNLANPRVVHGVNFLFAVSTKTAERLDAHPDVSPVDFQRALAAKGTEPFAVQLKMGLDREITISPSGALTEDTLRRGSNHALTEANANQSIGSFMDRLSQVQLGMDSAFATM